MSHLQYFDYPGFGENSKKALNYSQAVRIDNRIEISGQGLFLEDTFYTLAEMNRGLGSYDRGNS
jgi:hypothetical protein